MFSLVFLRFSVKLSTRTSSGPDATGTFWFMTRFPIYLGGGGYAPNCAFNSHKLSPAVRISEKVCIFVCVSIFEIYKYSGCGFKDIHKKEADDNSFRKKCLKD